MPFYLTEINERCRRDAAAFIAECEQIYAERLELAAERIQANLDRSPVVLLSGPSGSGKTTTAKKICEVLNGRGVKTHAISIDDYFLTVSPENTPRTPEGKYDLESPHCLDMDLLNQHFTSLSSGEEIVIPTYDFARRRRTWRYDKTLKLGRNEIALFEGIHALNDSITSVHPEAFKLYISARSNVLDDDDKIVFKGTWMRLTRRTVRDHQFRGTAAHSTLAHWANVRRGEKLYISPFKDKADLQFDSSFAHEVPIMNSTATELFNNMPADTPRYSELQALLSAFERFADLSPDLLPPDSLLREFLGGGIYN